MCVIIHSPDKKHRPSLSTLRQCERRNPHGSGLAWVEGKRVHYIKGLSAESIADSLDTLRGQVVIHFRWATVGGKRTSLCHPFPVTDTATPKPYGTAREVLFHNGHWCDWETFANENRLELEGPVSDSRVIAVGVYLGGVEWLRSVPSGRFVLMSSTSTELLGEWHDHQGCKFSNLNWVPQPKQPTLFPTCDPKKRRGGYRDPGDAMACFAD
jgi:hypothetical protein